jgi:AhpD family alkylhydroperoxidase
MALSKEVEAAYEAFVRSAYDSGIIEKKYVELMAFSNSVALDCLPCMKHHIVEAKKEGTTDQELAVAVAVAMAISSGKNRVKAKEALESTDE